MERKVECCGCESFMPESRSEPLANTNFPLATKPSQGSAQCAFRLFQSFLAKWMKTRILPWRTLSSERSDPTTRRLLLTHTGGKGQAWVGWVSMLPTRQQELSTSAEPFGQEWAGALLLGREGRWGGGESWTNLHPRRDAVHQIGSMQSVFVTC